MGSLKVFAAAAGLLAVSAAMSVAGAADLLPPPPPMPDAPMAEVGGGWYLRGDVGVSHYEGGKFRSPDLPPALFYGEDYGSGAFAGGGVGYQFNSWFRADVTGEYRFSTGFKVYDTINDPAFGTTRETTTGKYNAAVVMANGYFDLGTWYGVTPFVGGGVGVAFNNFQNFHDESIINFAAGGQAISGGVFRDRHQQNLAWALMAGLSYDVLPGAKLEVGYRYLNLGDVKTGVLNCFCGTTYSPIKSKELESHDIKLAMRWSLGGTSAPAYEPAPLIRKY